MPTKQVDVSRAARLMGRLGAAKGGRKLAKMLTPEERRERARAAVTARWDRWRKRHPKGPKVPYSAAEKALLNQLLDEDQVTVEVDWKRRPSGARFYKAAKKLVARGSVRLVEDRPNGTSQKITIALPQET